MKRFEVVSSLLIFCLLSLAQCQNCSNETSPFYDSNISECVSCEEYDNSTPYWDGSECVAECQIPTPVWDGSICSSCGRGSFWNETECDPVDCNEEEYWDGSSC